MNKCKKCQKITKNPKFCSRSCAISFNNKLAPKRKPEGRCKTCNKLITKQNTYCTDCTPRCRNLDTMTIGEYRNKNSVRNKHRSWLHAHIRSLARTKYKKELTGPCENCGYTLHVECCHIKPLHSFEDSILVSEVNDKSNILILCRNCHWEFDNGYLS